MTAAVENVAEGRKKLDFNVHIKQKLEAEPYKTDNKSWHEICYNILSLEKRRTRREYMLII